MKSFMNSGNCGDFPESKTPELAGPLSHNAFREIPDWRNFLGVLADVTGVSLRHIPADRIEAEPANAGHPFCEEMGSLPCIRSGCETFHAELRWRATMPGASPRIVCCPSGFSLFVIAIHDGAAGVVEGGRVLTMSPKKAIQHLDKRLELLGAEQIPESCRKIHAETCQIDLPRLSGVLSLARHILTSVPRPSSSVQLPEAVGCALQFMQENFKNPISISIVAKQVSLSEGYFSKLFIKSVGLPFSEYLIKARVTRARTLLATTNRRIGEIALDCGFESIPYFNRVFKRYTGHSPRQSREMASVALKRKIETTDYPDFAD